MIRCVLCDEVWPCSAILAERERLDAATVVEAARKYVAAFESDRPMDGDYQALARSVHLYNGDVARTPWEELAGVELKDHGEVSGFERYLMALFGGYCVLCGRGTPGGVCAYCRATPTYGTQS